MVFTEIKPQMKQLPPTEMLKAMAWLKHRLRVDSEANRQELTRLDREMDAGKKIEFEDLKRRLGLT